MPRNSKLSRGTCRTPTTDTQTQEATSPETGN